VDSTSFLKPLIPAPGVLTRRAPDAHEAADIAYGREIARQIAGLDLGQTVVIRDRACVAVEAMEGTDETIERAARIVEGFFAGRGEGQQAATGHAIRCTRCGPENRRSDAALPGDGAGDGRGPHAAV
jgi:DUF1009 family protein